MHSIQSSFVCVGELKAFSSFLSAGRRARDASKVLQPQRFGWDWVNHRWRQHSLISAKQDTGATGNTGEPEESPSNFPLRWDPFEDFFGLGVDLRSRKDTSVQQPKQGYELQMPCPTCEGRGFVFCPHCNSRKSEPSCPHCSGRGYDNCPQCHGECVVWEDYLNDAAWASLHSRSPLQIAEDDAIENMTISPTPRRITRRVYGPPGPETREKIRRALKELEARTGSISRRMRSIHQDPVLHAQRTAAIKKARGTDEARKLTSIRIKEYFKSPENRLKHSESMKGARFTCTACGEEGHRRHFCPKLGFKSKKTRITHSYHCSFCGQAGHGHRKCPEKQKLDSSSLITTVHSNDKRASRKIPKVYRCGLCHTLGHTRRSCPTLQVSKKLCSICRQAGHNRRTCSSLAAKQWEQT